MLAFTSLLTSLLQGNSPPTISSIITLVLGLLVAVVILAVLAPRLRIPYSILLVLGGLALGFIPALPDIVLDPNIVFLLFLPPLLYASAWTTSWRDFHANLHAISQLAIGLVLFTTIAVAVAAHFLMGLPWPVAFVLGAIVSPTDAVAATSIAKRLGIPNRIVTVLEGESLVNDASGLVVYRFAVAAVASGTFSLLNAGSQFVLVSIGGIVLGLAGGWCLAFLHRWMNNPPLEITVTLVSPFAIYLLGEEVLHVSGVLATVAMGLYLTWRAPNFFSSATRLQALAVWEVLTFLLNGLVFILIGLQLPSILNTLDISIRSPLILVGYALLIGVVVIIIRIVWAFLATSLPRMLSPRLRARDPYPGWRTVLMVGWTGMRGVVSLASALALPYTVENGSPFPERAFVIYLTFCVILATLVVQGLSLPLLIRKLGLHDDGAGAREEKKARQGTMQAALNHLDEIISQNGVSQELVLHLRTHYAARLDSMNARPTDAEAASGENSSTIYQHLEQEIIAAERKALLNLRNHGEINDEVYHRVEHELDLEEQRLAD